MYNADTPLANAIGAHLYRKTASFHTPGHKGRAPVLKSLSTLSADLTELPDTGSLYDGGDAIEAAVNRVLEKGLRTGDMMSEGCTPVGCRAMGDAICAEI